MEILADGALSLGLFPEVSSNATLTASEKIQSLIDTLAIKRFYPHNTSHWLGMDVHDAGFYHIKGEPRALEAGMVFTIEPGFYVQPGDMAAPEKYRGIGIRIEDDILVTATGCEVLTAAVVKEISDIEKLKA